MSGEGVRKQRAGRACTVGLFVSVALSAVSTPAQTPAADPAEPAESPSAAANTEQAAEPSGRLQDGIKVHGHWLIEVRSPDGMVVERREFDNALAPGGGPLLAQWLTHGGSPNRWTIELGIYDLTGPCNGGTGWNASNCAIVDAAASPRPTGTSIFPNLTASIAGSNSNQILLTGHATALVQGQIQFVATRQGSCFSSIAPENCHRAGTALQFTVHDLRDSLGQLAPLTVAAGQIVQVTVTISFS